jgi:tetratricopeptide (TPR) repeat protein
VRGRSYEQLVAEADRALEHGNTAKAQKFIEEALRLQPSGVAAVTSSAYLLLDKQKPLAAVGEFKRALNLSPNFPQALFGLGEAYRAAGNTGQAIEAYKHYLAASPAGADAPAARRQIRELETQPARPSHSATTTVPAGNAPPAAADPAPPP